MNIIDLINQPAPQTFWLLALQGEDMDNQSTEFRVELRGGKLYADDDDFRREIKVVASRQINGWGEALNGPAYEIAPVNGPGKTYVPQREWNRILEGKRSRA